MALAALRHGRAVVDVITKFIEPFLLPPGIFVVLLLLLAAWLLVGLLTGLAMLVALLGKF
mgnify:CR=1 FL=1